MDIDVEKMPLGKLSKEQVQRGHAVLQELADGKNLIDCFLFFLFFLFSSCQTNDCCFANESELKTGRTSSAVLNQLSSKFYTVIPHAFGRSVPPPINSAELLQKKIDLINTLSDIEQAQEMLVNSNKNLGDSDVGVTNALHKLLFHKFEALFSNPF
jgi:poly [ADP-ribose] polymerase